ncbi:corrinoid protein [Methanococcoides methylutens]|uniref:corrinoid protein n=1 Tax=Methanococcoides methylutens TaxID=2226 RepID=UPI004043CD34
MSETILNGLADAVVAGNANSSVELANKALEEGIDAYVAISDGLTRGMNIVADKFDKKELYVPHLMMASKAMSSAVDVLKPHIVSEQTSDSARIVAGTVHGDIHDIGLNLVNVLLESAGYNVKSLGVDVPNENFIEAAKEMNANVIVLSALMSTSMNGMKDVVEMSNEEIPNTKIMIGGGPVTQNYCDEIGANAYAENAPQAVKAIQQLMEQNITEIVG